MEKPHAASINPLRLINIIHILQYIWGLDKTAFRGPHAVFQLPRSVRAEEAHATAPANITELRAPSRSRGW